MEPGIKQSKLIGENIRRNRCAQKLTQEQLSAKLQVVDCDISRGTLAKIESGIRHISVRELEAIKHILDMDYKDFFKNE